MKTTRRSFIRNVSATGVVSIGASAPAFLNRAAYAGEKSKSRDRQKILVLVQLEGGNDGLNTVIPIGDPEYQKLRPGIAISKGAAHQLDDHHALHPAMLQKEGRTTMAFGVMGGQYQATGHAHVVTNLVDFGMDPQEALDSPRAFAEKGELKLETSHAPSVAADLEERGHKLLRPTLPIGGAQAITIDHDRGILIGASDPRKDGCAIGY